MPHLDEDACHLTDLDEITARDLRAMLAAATPAEKDLIERIRGGIMERLGNPDPMPPSATASTPAPSAWTWLAAYVLAAPAVADYLAARDIPPEVRAATLADVGRQARLHRAHTRRLGLDVLRWPATVLSGTFVHLGRLQFMVRALWPGEPAPPGLPDRPGAGARLVLDVHIPATGPLDPGSVAQSFRAATAFFPRHFPGHPVHQAICTSWLLDPRLAEGLRPDTNIARFAGLFQRYRVVDEASSDALYFTFGTRARDGRRRLPRDTALQRLVLDHLAAGGSWQVVSGHRWLDDR